jgi:hypothetical protein
LRALSLLELAVFGRKEDEEEDEDMAVAVKVLKDQREQRSWVVARMLQSGVVQIQ